MPDNDSTPDQPTKQCDVCKQTLPATSDYFWRSKSQPYGVRNICKTCTGVKRRRHWQENTEQINEKRRRARRDNIEESHRKEQAYREKNRERLNEQRRVLNATNRARARANNKKSYLLHIEKRNAESRRYYQTHKEEHATYGRTYALAHKEELQEAHHRWVRANRHRLKVNYQRREARKRELLDTLTPDDWRRALDYFHGCCAVCGRQGNDLFDTHIIAADHWIPLSSPDCPGTIPTNILPLCHGVGGCNNSKRDKAANKWLIERYGKKRAAEILARIETYFEWVRRPPA